jgi:hypothetical protein
VLLELNGTALEATDFLVHDGSSWLKHAQYTKAPSMATVLIPATIPTHTERLKALHDALQGLQLADILKISLAITTKAYDTIPDVAKPLIPHLSIISLDTESYTNNSDLLTELGIVIINHKQAEEVDNPGEHGNQFLGRLKFLHLRILEHAHLLSDPPNVPDNLYGKSRFVTLLEARTILHGLLNAPINVNRDSELYGCKAPIVLMGHALHHDISTALKPGFDYDIVSNNTIVATVDTQPLAREVGVYVRSGRDNNSEIGLLALTKELGFSNTVSHSACNDAASTIICAIHMVLDDNLRKPESATRTLRQWVEKLREVGKSRNPPPFGTATCCIRCGARDHDENDCSEDVSCEACKEHKCTDGTSNLSSHSRRYCCHVAAFKAGIRRVFLASSKNKNVLKAFTEETTITKQKKGDLLPPSHPWESWPKSQWPTNNPYQALADLERYPERPHNVINLEAALHNFPVPVEGEWLLKNGSVRRAPAGPRRPSYAAALGTPSPVGAGPLRPSYAATAATSSPVGTTQQETTLTVRGRGRGQEFVRGQGSLPNSATGIGGRGHGRDGGGENRGGRGENRGGSGRGAGHGNWRGVGSRGDWRASTNWRAGSGGDNKGPSGRGA